MTVAVGAGKVTDCCWGVQERSPRSQFASVSVVAAGFGWKELARGALWVLERVLPARNQFVAETLGLAKGVLAARAVPVEEAVPGRKVVRPGESVQAETKMQGVTATVPGAP